MPAYTAYQTERKKENVIAVCVGRLVLRHTGIVSAFYAAWMTLSNDNRLLSSVFSWENLHSGPSRDVAVILAAAHHAEMYGDLQKRSNASVG